jgi:hypothetical protein
MTESVTTGNIGQYSDRTNGPVLPLGSYSFSALRASSPKTMVSDYLRKIDEVEGLRGKQAQNLRRQASERLARFPAGTGEAAQQQFQADFAANAPTLKRGVCLAVERQYGIALQPRDFALDMVQLAEADWRAKTDLGARLRLGEQELHDVVGSWLSAACMVNLRLDVMRSLSAVSGFQPDGELPLLEEKFAAIARHVDPDVNEDRFVRVREIAGLPAVDPDPRVHDVDLPRLLDITSGPEAKEFRAWLRTVDGLSDQELADAFHPIRDALGEVVRSPVGKAVRFATTTVAGVAFPPAAIPLGLLDTFVTEKILPGPGPTAFLSKLFPSIFDRTW